MRLPRTFTLAAALIGCGGSDGPNPDVAAVRGRLESSADTVTVARIEAGGRLEAVATARVEGGATYRVEEVPPGEGPFLIEAKSGSRIIGRALVPMALTAMVEQAIVPVDAESTAEANAYLELSTSSEIDPITVMAAVDAELAAESSADVNAAVSAAHRAWLEAGARLRGSAVGARQLAKARANAFAKLAADLDAAASA